MKNRIGIAKNVGLRWISCGYYHEEGERTPHIYWFGRKLTNRDLNFPMPPDGPDTWFLGEPLQWKEFRDKWTLLRPAMPPSNTLLKASMPDMSNDGLLIGSNSV